MKVWSALVLLAALACAPAATPAASAAWALYVQDRFDGSNLIRLDPLALADASDRPLLPIAPSSANTFVTLASADGRTVVVLDYSTATKPFVRVFDAATGEIRSSFVPPRSVIVDGITANGSRLLAREWPPRDLGASRVLVDTSRGEIVAKIAAAAVCCVQRYWLSDEKAVLYTLSVPEKPDTGGPVSPTLVAQEAESGRELGRVELSGVRMGTWWTQRQVAGGLRVLAMLQPGFARSKDGRRFALVHADRQAMTLIDADLLAVLSERALARPTSWLDHLPFRPLVAYAKAAIDGTSWGAQFSPDGRLIYAWGSESRADENGEEVRRSLGLRVIDVELAQILAEGLEGEPITWVKAAPDGSAVFALAARPFAGTNVTKEYILRRLHARTLAVEAERAFNTYREVHFLAPPHGLISLDSEPEDQLGGALIAHEAGALLTDFAGRATSLAAARLLACGSPELQATLATVLAPLVALPTAEEHG